MRRILNGIGAEIGRRRSAPIKVRRAQPDRSATRRDARFDVGCRVPHHPGLEKVNAVFTGCLLEHLGLRLAATAFAASVMWTVINPINRYSLL